MGSEAETIAATGQPVSTTSLVRDLRALGLADGDLVIVHSSLSALGWVAGGAQAVVEALLACVGPSGTIVMPAQSGQLTDPKDWSDPPVPAAWHDDVREHQPAFDPALTGTRGMGAIVDCFRSHQATVRGPHPLVSFVALGPLADEVVGRHPLEQAMDDASPLGRLYDHDELVLLLGVDHGNDTSLHLAEHRADWDGKRNVIESAPMLVDGRRERVSYSDLDRDDTDFSRIGDDFAATGGERSGPVGAGTGRLVRQREIVDFAVDWITAHRPASLAD